MKECSIGMVGPRVCSVWWAFACRCGHRISTMAMTTILSSYSSIERRIIGILWADRMSITESLSPNNDNANANAGFAAKPLLRLESATASRANYKLRLVDEIRY
ncbi:hypothetical protein FRC16_006888 [Serendipita sp. 398]|nr:hypothetical protein FRC16_006888 [Serendipita sp. 398]